MASDRHTSRFNLARRDAPRLDRLHAKVAEGDIGATLREASIVSLLHLAEFRSLGRQHGVCPSLVDNNSVYSSGVSPKPPDSGAGDRPAVATLEDLALEDPNLDADDSVLRTCLREAEL